MRKKLIDTILNLASDEFETITDIKELAIMTDEQLVDRLIDIINYFVSELRDLNEL